VWIVDDKSNRVYRYAGAASRLSGSQSADSSFNLASGNGSPRDIVTDGTSLWVVNNSSTDKVFKYTVGGSLVGSWTIDSANSQPTGLTIDPANVSDIWIVDSGDDRVYQYTGAASRTSGSQDAAGWFALSAGNSNPQGIADPPPPSARRYDMFVTGRSESYGSGDLVAAGPSLWLPTFAVETKTVKKPIHLEAREHAFEWVATERYDLSSSRAPWRQSIDREPGMPEVRSPVAGEHDAVDIALESVFAGMFAAPLGK
jgi:hypothetical protein